MLNRLISNFELRFPSVTQDVYKYDGTRYANELIVTFRDGSKILYNDFENTVRNLPVDSGNMSEKQFRREFGYRVKRIMLEKGVTQDELSEKTGIAQETLSRYICGKNVPSFYKIDKIAKALDCSVDEFRYI